MSVRRQPHIGDRVTVAYLAATVRGTVEDFDEHRRRILVMTDDGDIVAFVFNRGTARFHAEDHASGARLVFDADHDCR